MSLIRGSVKYVLQRLFFICFPNHFLCSDSLPFLTGRNTADKKQGALSASSLPISELVSFFRFLSQHKSSVSESYEVAAIQAELVRKESPTTPRTLSGIEPIVFATCTLRQLFKLQASTKTHIDFCSVSETTYQYRAPMLSESSSCAVRNL